MAPYPSTLIEPSLRQEYPQLQVQAYITTFIIKYKSTFMFVLATMTNNMMLPIQLLSVWYVLSTIYHHFLVHLDVHIIYVTLASKDVAAPILSTVHYVATTHNNPSILTIIQ